MMVNHKSFLKWAGGKYRLLPRLLSAFPNATRFVEPFLGSGVVFLNTDYPSYLLGEGNRDLITLFQSLQRDGMSYIDYCASFFCPENNQEEQYYRLRERFNTTTDVAERGAIFLYLNRHGFNGLCRYNQRGGFNVPFGLYHRPYFPREEMMLFYAKSQCVEFVHADFLETFQNTQSGDLIYCDPPYAPLGSADTFSSYIEKAFGDVQQQKLADAAREAMTKGATVMISNHDTPQTRQYYHDAEIIPFQVRRSISAHGGRRVMVPELLAIFRPYPCLHHI